jgi:hypothetical protein
VEVLVEHRRTSAGTPGREGGTRVNVAGRDVLLLEPADWGVGRAGGAEPEACVVLSEKGLTLGLFLDTIAGIKGGSDVKEHHMPPLIAEHQPPVSGVVEYRGRLFLSLDLERAGGGRDALTATVPLRGGSQE